MPGEAMTSTFILAVLALIISTSSLTWQIVQYLLGASRPFVDLQAGGLVEGEAVIMPIEGTDFGQLDRMGFGTPVVAVQIQNRGRLAVSVTSWSITFDNGARFIPSDWYPNDKAPLPHRLEPGAEVIYLCDLHHIAASELDMRRSKKPAKSCRAAASFGTGKVVRSKTKLTFPVPVITF